MNDLHERVRMAVCGVDYDKHPSEDDEQRIVEAVMPIVNELAADLDHAERENRRLTAENAKLKR